MATDDKTTLIIRYSIIKIMKKKSYNRVILSTYTNKAKTNFSFSKLWTKMKLFL
jgi:hypothetical protein